MIEVVFGALLGAIFEAILLGVLALYFIRSSKITEILMDFIAEVSVNEQLQKNLFTVGALIGNGAASGAGIQKKGGKFGLNDLIMQIAGQYLGNMFPQPQQPNEPIIQPQQAEAIGLRRRNT